LRSATMRARSRKVTWSGSGILSMVMANLYQVAWGTQFVAYGANDTQNPLDRHILENEQAEK
jgi:hypothetical protein